MRTYIIFPLLAISFVSTCPADITYDIVIGDGTSYTSLGVNNKNVLVDGGSVRYFSAYNQSVVDIIRTTDYPGLLIGMQIISIDNSTMNVCGGKLEQISTSNNANLFMSGGIITEAVYIEGSFNQVHVSGGVIPIIDLIGTYCDLHFWGYNFTYQELNLTTYLLTGFWENGEAFSTIVDDYYYPDKSRIIFHEIPEPATLVLLGGGLLFLGLKQKV